MNVLQGDGFEFLKAGEPFTPPRDGVYFDIPNFEEITGLSIEQVK